MKSAHGRIARGICIWSTGAGGRNGRWCSKRIWITLGLLWGVAAMVCVLEELIAEKVAGHVVALFSRGEEVGFAGVLAVCENGWLPKEAAVIGLETSKAMPSAGGAAQGAGPIIRVGDRTG